MNKLTALVLIALSSPVFAASSPATLECTSTGAGPAARFELGRMDTDVPSTTLDARTDGKIERDGMTTRFCANNGCDNSYCFTFFTDDLELAASHRRETVTGLMNYSNSEVEGPAELRGRFYNDEFAQTIPIACRARR